MQTTVFNVSGIENTNSGVNLKDAIISLPGVSNVGIDIHTSRVTITFDPNATNISTIRKTIATSGYSIQ